MDANGFQRARDAFVAAYTTIDELAASLTDEQLLSSSRCRGWAVCDVLCHLDFGMQEILVGFASPTDRPAYARPSGVVRHLHLTTGAALRQGRAAIPDQRLEFQGHVVTMEVFLAIWAVEAAIHHLDVTVELPDAPLPPPASLAVTRETLDALLGEQAPAGWDDTTYALKGTGRLALTGEEARALGPLAARFPLFG